MTPISLPVAELKPALTGLAKIIGKKCTLPVLNHLKLERTKDGWIALTATDLDSFVSVRLEQPSEGEPLSLLVPYDDLTRIAKICPKTDTLLITGNDKAVTIQYALGNQVADAKLASLPVNEFPEIPRIKGEAIALPDTLRQAVLDALDCASADPTRLILNSAYIDTTKPDAHYVVGTDGRHLYSSNSFRLPLKDSLIIPNHKFIGWKEFNRDGEWQLKIAPPVKKEDSGHLQISSRRWRFITRQIEGNFPNWRQVVPDPKQFATSLDFNPDAVNSLVPIIERMPCDDAINFAIGLELIGRKLSLIAKAPNDEKWTKVPVTDVKATGKDVTIFFNRHLFAKALQFGLTKVEIIDPLSPLRFNEGRRQMIIMPTRPDRGPKPVPTPPTPTPAAAQPTPPPPSAETKETSPMPAAQSNGHTNGAAKTPATAATNNATTLETALAQIEVIKGDFRNAIAGLNKLTEHLKQVQREQKTSDKEIQSVRQTLRSLQTVRI